jgi:hypothetical protein
MDWGNKNDDEMCYSQIAPKHQRCAQRAQELMGAFFVFFYF